MTNFKGSINNFLLLVTGFFLYGTIINADKGFCDVSEPILICKPISILSEPPKIVYDGINDLHAIIKKGTSINDLFKNVNLMGMVARENNSLKRRFKLLDSGFNFTYQKGKRPNAGFILLSRASNFKNGLPEIELWDLNQQEMIYSWDLSKAIEYINSNSKNIRYFLNPIVLEDGSLIFNTQGGDDLLFRLDRYGEIQNINQELNFHHSINLDSRGNIYACFNDGTRQGYAILDQNLNILEVFYLDEIYEKHNLLPRLYSSNSVDPTHINDVEPLLNLQSDYKNEELVLISLRSTSSIILYNQKTKKIVTIFDGFVSQQHDVDVINSTPLEISVFDNNILDNKSLGNKVLFLKGISTDSNSNNMINVYMPNSRAFELSNIKKNIIDFSNLNEEERPKTKSSGLSEYNKLNNSLIIEESNFGRIFEYDLDTGKIVWSFLNTDIEKKVFWRMSWSRFYLDNPIKLN